MTGKVRNQTPKLWACTERRTPSGRARMRLRIKKYRKNITQNRLQVELSREEKSEKQLSVKKV